MGSGVVDGGLAGALDLLAAGVDAVFAAGVEPVDAADARVLCRELECQGRRLAAAQLDLLGEVTRRGLHRGDGHGSVKVWARHVANVSNLEAHRRAQAVRALADLPVVAEAVRAGRIGSCQVGAIARAHANERVRKRLCGEDAKLARLAAREPYRVFDARLADWVRLADEDGTRDRSARSHGNRDAKMAQDLEHAWTLTAGCGSLQGLQLHDILQHFIDAETASDWARARALHGEAATAADLARSDAQRRFDALYEIFQRAAGSTPGGAAALVTNLLIDQVTFERTVARLAGTRPPGPDPRLADLLDAGPDSDSGGGGSDGAGCAGGSGSGGAGSAAVGFRCSGIDGHPVDPTEAVAASLIGHIRRVVIDADSTVIDLSRRRRLFTGNAALAVKLQSTVCYWPGCQVPVSACQSDHLIAWADHGGGSTNPGNGGPACGRHNRMKERGFTVWRDPAGRWHTYRPDGTEIE